MREDVNFRSIRAFYLNRRFSGALNRAYEGGAVRVSLLPFECLIQERALNILRFVRWRSFGIFSERTFDAAGGGNVGEF